MQVISWQRAVTMVFLDKVEVVRNYEAYVRTISSRYPLPAVVRLHNFVKRHRVRLGFSRRNLFTRDGFRCQYCGKHCPPQELTCDHVVPRSQGGGTDWDNIVASCGPCNRRKGGRTPEQAGMRLLSRPARPKDLPMMLNLQLGAKRTPEAWHDFLSWAKANNRFAG